MSAAFQIKKAERKNAKMKINLGGPSGSGKTMSALRLAHGLVGDWKKIVVIDTENDSASLYSHLGDYNTLVLTAPFDPRKYVDAIKFCERDDSIECIVIDSISHEWEGIGGCLEIHSKLGGKFETWAKVTPLHDAFKSAIIGCSKHVVTTVRSKTEYEFTGKKDSADGKGRVEKIGLKSITREGFDYEVTLSFKLSQDHLAEIDKDRTNLFAQSVPFMITEKTGELIRDWNDSGKIVKDLSEEKKAIIKNISIISDDGKNVNMLKTIFEKLGIRGSKDIFACEDEEKLGNWYMDLNELLPF